MQGLELLIYLEGISGSSAASGTHLDDAQAAGPAAGPSTGSAGTPTVPPPTPPPPPLAPSRFPHANANACSTFTHTWTHTNCTLRMAMSLAFCVWSLAHLDHSAPCTLPLHSASALCTLPLHPAPCHFQTTVILQLVHLSSAAAGVGGHAPAHTHAT